ncbi:nitronate monooxygenase [Corynebacterium sp.]|uniref:NAD(P)H-dependent flavin oxidoreductase n=1 Tax=Corynebacterium TaxID=1716 RepID=UPI002914F4C5|nr:nitronate monooxygenase [Corynebacterium sp.]MDU4570947.1 nitronate monooxygenase [Corynebacterium sp.]MDU6013958.1 nitronate monooxygenase [Corynebacterium sp.]
MHFFEKPIVLAPMAGGPSTPDLCAAVSEAGGLGFLASGYLSADDLAEQITIVENQTDRFYGINLFCPASINEGDSGSYSAYRDQLIEKLTFSSELPKEPIWSDDNYEEKLDIAIGSHAKFISFTFGYPEKTTIKSVQSKGKNVVLNATTPEEIDHVLDLGADVLALQGKNAGGHRATVISSEQAGTSYTSSDLLRYAVSKTRLPIFAGGGVGTASDVVDLIRAGATAVIVGTRFLTANEAGTKQTHRRAILNFTDRETATTRAFSGKIARSIRNDFIDQFSSIAPAMYPEIHYLTAPIRAEANADGNPEALNLWAGDGFGHCREDSAENIIDELLPYSRTWSQQGRGSSDS